MSYTLARKLLFRFPAEASHDLSLKALKAADNAGVLSLFLPSVSGKPIECMGLQFPNAVGLAAGLDKNGDYIDGLSKFGFGFVEVGTVTPCPQLGNPKPRLFRLAERDAIINRMGFNNEGIDHMVARLQRKKFAGIVGVNVGKNKDTPAEVAQSDYITCIQRVYELASYIAINISSPNTPGLRALQFGQSLRSMLQKIKECQESQEQKTGRHVPFVVKIAPDMSDDEIKLVAKTILDYGMDGVVATNTTLSREGVEGLVQGKEQGGLSGAPLTKRSTHVVHTLCQALEAKIPVIASGGVMSGQDAVDKIAAGASLVQIYSGLIYRGPTLVREAVEALANKS